MQFSFAVIAAVLATAVSAHYGYGYSNTTSAAYVTEVVSSYTTYCPYATEVTLGGKTYTVTEATTLTVTDYPHTVVKPVYVSPVVYCKTCSSGAPVYWKPTAAVAPTGGYAAPTAAAPISPEYKGAASKAVAGAGGLAAAALIAVLAL